MSRKRLTEQERKVHPSAYGGILRNRRRGRGRRTLSTHYSMHLVLRARWAHGAWSFTEPKIRRMINGILKRHSSRVGVQLLGIGNAGNHLHLRIQLPSRRGYCKFIRAVTGEIALKIKKTREEFYAQKEGPFWARRPYSAIVAGARYVVNVIQYLKINELEGVGYSRTEARAILSRWKPP